MLTAAIGLIAYGYCGAFFLKPPEVIGTGFDFCIHQGKEEYKSY